VIPSLRDLQKLLINQLEPLLRELPLADGLRVRKDPNGLIELLFGHIGLPFRLLQEGVHLFLEALAYLVVDIENQLLDVHVRVELVRHYSLDRFEVQEELDLGVRDGKSLPSNYPHFTA
jgi:hypothetical protein